MRYRLAIVTIGILSIASLAACERSKPEPVEVGGKGGSSTIYAIPRHHSKNIDSCTIYIKYNTNDLPSPNFSASQYDDSMKCVKVNGDPTATFSGLKKGKYYLYGIGYDPSISSKVEAGKPVTVSTDGTMTVVVPVTEGD